MASFSSSRLRCLVVERRAPSGGWCGSDGASDRGKRFPFCPMPAHPSHFWTPGGLDAATPASSMDACASPDGDGDAEIARRPCDEIGWMGSMLQPRPIVFRANVRMHR